MKKVSTAILALGLLSAALVARADTLAYATIDYGSFGTLDLTTGVYTKSFAFPDTLAGLGVDNGQLYGASLNSNVLYTINPVTKAYTSANTGITFYDFGSTLNSLYALNPTGELYSVNPVTKATTAIGNVNLPNFATDYSNLSVNSQTLYLVDASTLYSVNLGNAAVTKIGDLTNQQYTSLLTTNNKLYAVSNNIYTYDTGTHVESSGLAVTGDNFARGYAGQGVYGLAPDPVPAVPLPPSVVLLLSGVSLMIFVVRRRPRGDVGAQAA